MASWWAGRWVASEGKQLHCLEVREVKDCAGCYGRGGNGLLVSWEVTIKRKQAISTS